MEIKVFFTFQVYNLELKHKIDQILSSLIKDFVIPEADIFHDDVYVKYKFEIMYNRDLIQSIISELNILYEKSLTYKNMSDTFRDFRYKYEYTTGDIENAELFKIGSIGNKPDLYISNKNKPELRTFCRLCLRKVQVSENVLFFNTSVLKKTPLVFVDECLVISGDLADKFRDWNISGCMLQEVKHKGSKETERSAYKVIPTNILPPQPEFTPLRDDPQITMRKCHECGVIEHLKVPLIFDDTVYPYINDFNLTHEYYDFNNRVVREMLISKRVKSLLVKHGVATIEHGSDDENWTFIPVLTNTTL